MKPLLPTLKEKKRYIVYDVLSDVKHSQSAVTRAIKKSIYSYLGLSKMSRAGVLFLPKRWNQAQQRGMVRINRGSVDEAKAALTLIAKIDQQHAIVRSVTVSGTIKKAAACLAG